MTESSTTSSLPYPGRDQGREERLEKLKLCAKPAPKLETVVYYHDDRLDVSLREGLIRRPTEQGLPFYQGTLSLGWNKDSGGIPSTLDLAREFRARYPGATAMVFTYGRFSVLFEGALLDEALSDVAYFEYWMNYAWISLYHESIDDNHFAAPAVGLVRDIDPSTLFYCLVGPGMANTAEELLRAMQLYGYVLLHEAIGVVDPGNEDKVHMYTGGGTTLVETQFGPLLSGLQYYDLRAWLGEVDDDPGSHLRTVTEP
ncbi:hypothetical protein L2Y94_02245 [Luteibacter aegosomatis]|uniref:hypothetical protein n=1 Tax=Luteibacter aegosomatis TaxID=2911537 RepID=UPI001FF88B49|nr:hypothetical protein [Luteibacter aegosomatis]UPG86208.1 hypothetical protein L2Y94_02245 [Luteibacter aegosomatis]